MKDKLIPVIEWFNEDGVCVERSVKGNNLPTDDRAVVEIFGNANFVVQRHLVSREELKDQLGEEWGLE